MQPLDAFSPACRAWFGQSFGQPTPVQAAGWGAIARGEHALLLAPTGSGKTLAAFFWAIHQLSTLPAEAPLGTRVLYVSPLKALVADIERNLRAPLVGVQRAAERLGERTRPIEVGVRTGDTPAKERARARARPPDILVTTPESLFLLLGSSAKRGLAHVHTVIVDEIHALAPSKRGAHLSLCLERLEALCERPFQRIGLSATVRPHAEAARFLAGARPVTVVDKSARAKLSLLIEVPCEDMSRPPPIERPAHVEATEERGGSILGALAREAYANEAGQQREQRDQEAAAAPNRELQGMWAVIYPRILALIDSHASTIVFVNSRSLCERMAQTLNDLAGAPWVRAHHGSVSRRNREEMEEALKSGALRGIVATSSLELGIDMGSIDLVVLVESPGSVARGLQRVGRAGHGVGEMSQGICFPKHVGDLMEAVVVGERMREGELEPICVPKLPLDVLSQHVVAEVAEAPARVDDVLAWVRRAYPFAKCSKAALQGVVDMLSGGYADDDFAEFKPLLSHDRTADTIVGRPHARLTATLNGGTIVDRGLFGVFLVGEGPRVGELDEEMVHESRKGDVFALGASAWRIEEITRDQVRVSPAPGQPGKMPFWRGEGPGRPMALGRAIGAMSRELLLLPEADAAARLAERYGCNDHAAHNLLRHVRAQQEANGCIPSDVAVTIERFRDEVGDYRVCILTPFGTPVHAPWAMLLEARLSERLGQPIDALYTNDGIALRIGAEGGNARAVAALEASDFLLEADEATPALTDQLGRSALFASHFRENATRALLLTRRRTRGRAPLWQQRLRAKTLLAAATRYPSFPIVLETYRQLLRDVFDMPALEALLKDLASRRVRLDWVERDTPSPFARTLAFAYAQTYLYELDAPAAERQAQALTLDRELLRELLGEDDLRSVLDAGACDQVEAQLAGRAPPHSARDADEVSDLLRRLGDLSADEVAERLAPPRDPALEPLPPAARAKHYLRALQGARRAVPLTVAGEPRWVALEDVARYRDGLGVVLPSGLPARHLAAARAPLEALVSRFAKTHGPFDAEQVAARFALSRPTADALCRQLAGEEAWLHGALDPRHERPVYCHPDVVRRLKRATLEKVRQKVAALPPRAFARLLPAWQGATAPRRGPEALREAIGQLGGLPLPFSALLSDILPARVAQFTPEQLDMACATGAVAWVAAGSLGPRDGRVRLLLREQLPLLLEPPAPMVDASPLHAALLSVLEARGPSFFVVLQQQVAGRPSTEALKTALWDLVWAGLVTNDTVAPLREVCAAKAGAGRGRGRAALQGIGGRWSLVRHEMGAELPPETARRHAQAVGLLERWGLVCRDVLGQEALAGGFSALYPVLRALEDNGRVRRGLFVEGLSSAQFAMPAAIERLRAGEDAAEGRERPPISLAAVDPAQPYGAVLPWPKLVVAEGQRRLRRTAGARLLLQEGVPLAYLEANGEQLWRFEADAADAFGTIVDWLRGLAARHPSRTLVLRTIDGRRALEGAEAREWLAAGMHPRFDGLSVGISQAR